MWQIPVIPALERLGQSDLNLQASLGYGKREWEGGKGGARERGFDGLERREGREERGKRKKRGVVEMPQWMKYLCKHELGIQTSSTR